MFGKHLVTLKNMSLKHVVIKTNSNLINKLNKAVLRLKKKQQNHSTMAIESFSLGVPFFHSINVQEQKSLWSNSVIFLFLFLVSSLDCPLVSIFKLEMVEAVREPRTQLCHRSSIAILQLGWAARKKHSDSRNYSFANRCNQV